MSANRASDGSSLSLERGQVGIGRCRAPRRRRCCAPSSSARSPNAERVESPAPSSSMPMVKLAVPSLRPGRPCSRRGNSSCICTTGVVVALGQHHLDAVGQRRALQRRELQVGEAAGTGTPALAVDVAGAGLELRIDRAAARRRRPARPAGSSAQRGALAGLHHQGVVARRQPFAAGSLTLRRRWPSSMSAGVSRKQPGLPVYTAHSASASALPPKPPMRSMPRTKPARSGCLARSSSAAVGPSRAGAAVPRRCAFSTLAASTPCLTSA